MKLRWLIDYDGERRLQQLIDGEWQDVETVEYYSLKYDEAQHSSPKSVTTIKGRIRQVGPGPLADE